MRTWLPSTMNRWLIWTESDITNCHLPQTVNQPSAWFFLKTGLKQQGKIIINLNSHKFKNTLKFKNKLNFTFEFKTSWKHRLQLLKPYLCTWFYLAIGQYSLAQWMAKDSPKFWASLCKEAGQLHRRRHHLLRLPPHPLIHSNPLNTELVDGTRSGLWTKNTPVGCIIPNTVSFIYLLLIN